MTIEASTKKTKTHTVYRNRAGDQVPGVTTMTGQLDKPALLYWAWNLGMEGIDFRKYRDEKADIGTCAHEIITESLQGREIDEGIYAPTLLSAAQNSALSFWEAVKGDEYEVLGVEMPLVSEQYQYGGTCDIYWRYKPAGRDWRFRLTDLKTGKAIFPEMFAQVAGGYMPLLVENGYPVDEVEILNVPRIEDDAFDRQLIKPEKLPGYQEAFRILRRLYRLKKDLGWK